MAKQPARGATSVKTAAAPVSRQAAAVAPKPAALPSWLVRARGNLGVHEGDGIHSNPTVLRFFLEVGHGEVKNDHATPWCGAFVGAMLHEDGKPVTATPLWALSWKDYGQRLAGPAVGAIGVKRRNGGGHVFFVVGWDAHNVYALGGNQNDRVCIERISRAAIDAYRWPPGVPLPALAASGGVSSGVAGATEA